MSGPATCRFGVECRRPDCWFAHPNGRNLEQGGPMPPGGASMGGMGMGMGMGMMHAPMGYGYVPPHQQIPIHGVPPMYNGQAQQGAPVMSSIIKPHQHQPAGSQENKKPSKQPVPCRFGRECRREGCWFPHPDGRELDEQPPTTNAHLNGKGVIRSEVKDAFTDDSFDDEDDDEENDFDCPCCHGQPNDCQTPTCKAAGRCACQFGTNENVADDTWRDEWFPASRTCACCEGYIYRCKKQDSGCESGNCFCSLTKNVTDTTATTSLDGTGTSTSISAGGVSSSSSSSNTQSESQ